MFFANLFFVLFDRSVFTTQESSSLTAEASMSNPKAGAGGRVCQSKPGRRFPIACTRSFVSLRLPHTEEIE